MTRGIHDTRASKSLVQLVAEEGVVKVLKKLLRFHDADYKFKFAQELERTKLQWEHTPDGYSREVLLGTYHLLERKYFQTFGEEFGHTLHRRIQQNIKDKRTLTDYRRKQNGS